MATTHGHSHSPDHGHSHVPGLQHHFDSPEQQKEAVTLGMWAFLATEIMLFGGIFMAYVLYRWAYPEIWAEAAATLNTPLATVNTVVLLISSLTVALAVHAAAHGNNRRVIVLLAVTLVLGFGFLGIKFTEYGEKFMHCAGASSFGDWMSGNLHEPHECLVPGNGFHFAAEGAEGAEAAATTHAATAAETTHAAAPAGGQRTPHQLFFFLYFCATGLHAVHMVIGITIVSTIMWMTSRGKFSPEYYTPIEIGGLYWHLIDIVWVFLFPLFYLV